MMEKVFAQMLLYSSNSLAGADAGYLSCPKIPVTRRNVLL